MRSVTVVVVGLCVLALVVMLCGCGGSGVPVGSAGPGDGALVKPQPPPPPPLPPEASGKLVGSKLTNPAQNLWGVFTMDTNGTGKTQVNVGGVSALARCWVPPNGDLILVGLSKNTVLATVPRAGGTPTVVVARDEPGLPMGTGGVANNGGDWYQSGSLGKLVFSRYWVDEEYYNRHALVVKDLPNGPVRLLTEGGPLYRDEKPTWSPDGQYVLFNHHDHITQQSRLMVLPAAGGVSAWYVSDDLSVSNASDWYSDGATNWIVYSSGDGSFAKLQVDATGHALGDPIPLPTGGSSADYRSPRWSPNGDFIAFSNGTWTKKGPIFTTYILDVAEGDLYNVGDLYGVDWAAQ